MNTKLIETQWAGYESLLPVDAIEKKLVRPLGLIGEDMLHLIPSFGLGTDGPFIEAVIITTKTMLCEVRLKNLLDDFDVVMLETIANYRVSFNVHKVAKTIPNQESQKPVVQLNPPAIETMVYETAKVRFIHNFSAGFETVINYVGNAREPWMKLVFTALPLSILKLSSGR